MHPAAAAVPLGPPHGTFCPTRRCPPGFETILYIARIAAAAWPLLLCSSALIMLAVGLHLYQLRIQVGAAGGPHG